MGVAEDGKYHDMQESPQPVVYLPLSQNEQSRHDFRRAVAAGAERDGGGARTHAERHRAECANHGAELARCDGGCAFPGTGRDSGTGRHGPAGGDAGGDGHLRHGGLQREPPDEGAGHPRGLGRAHEACDERRGRAANCAAWASDRWRDCC